MILRCADRPYGAWTDESKETLRRSRQLTPQQLRESRHSGTAALGHKQRLDRTRFEGNARALNAAG
jgi:hypothetical protein